ncbi:interleukin-13 receptor subunit alpha-1 [Siphateles boraxobius]|uniref:interleukin-13 receptor subunit alpha-1 n=1 Tax=Siphateles boraxobius TaxID=180520 RepID=UPI00406476E3
MYRFWNLSMMICFSVSVMYVGSDNTPELPPPKNLNFIWVTPFRLSLTWEKPEDLDPYCKVNYTVHVRKSQDCSSKEAMTKSFRVSTLSHKVNVSNENGLCISVSTYPENCGGRDHSPSTDIILPPPPVRLVTDRSYEYSHSRMKCTWKPVDDVQDLSFYYWLPWNESIIKCIPDETMKVGGCIIHNEQLRHTMEIYYLFNGTRNGVSVSNTFEDERPAQYIKLNKPQLTIHEVGEELHFETHESDSEEFAKDCYIYQYTYSKCNENLRANGTMKLEVQYDPACKYRASVQVLFAGVCGSGKSDPSDEVEYGENRDPNLPALLAVIIIPLIVSCCLLVSLVLLKRHKNIIFPKIPQPTLLFKDMFNNITEDQQNPATVRLFFPTEETVETRITLELQTLSTKNVQQTSQNHHFW